MEGYQETKGTDLSRTRRGTTKKQEILYKFYVADERIPFRDVEKLLTQARIVINGIYGEAAMQLETRLFRLYQERTIYIDGNTFLGQCLAKAFTALLRKSYCERLVELKRVPKQQTLADMAGN